MIHGQQESTQRTLNIVFNNDELPRQIPGNWVTPPGRRRRVFPPRRTGSLNQPGKQRIKWFNEYRIRFASFVRLGASPQPTTSLTWPSCPLVGLPVVRRLRLWLRLIFFKAAGSHLLLGLLVLLLDGGLAQVRHRGGCRKGVGRVQGRALCVVRLDGVVVQRKQLILLEQFNVNQLILLSNVRSNSWYSRAISGKTADPPREISGQTADPPRAISGQTADNPWHC